MYRCEAVSAEAFVQQLACNLVNHGYWFYTVGHVPPGKDPRAVDRKLIDGYGLEISKWQRARLKAKGHAKLSYLRHERFFVLLATAGEHIFYQREGRVLDVRRQPIVFDGYSIGCSKGSDGRYHASVKIHADTFNERRAYLLGLAPHRSADTLVRAFQSVQFTPYARVRRQLLRLLREVNDARRAAGFVPVPISALQLRRVPVKVFADEAATTSSSTTNIASARSVVAVNAAVFQSKVI
jgi:hypothetical protein